MASMKDIIATIKLAGETDPSLTKAFQKVSQLSDTHLSKLSKYGESVKKGLKAAGTGAVIAGGYALKSAIDYESAFAGVQKTVEETDTTKYEDLSKGIRKMAKVTPAAATEIADVAAAAGQLGIKADNVLDFTKTMIDLGESTNLSSEEAATAIAKLFNVTGTSMDKVGNFGATLVALGNNAATTEADIMNMASRIAGSGKQIGLTEQQTLALATSLSSVGIEAEMGGSAISTVMTKIDKSVATNDETLKTWAKTAGMSTSQFKNAWDKDAYGAMQKVIGGMGKTAEEGGNLNLILDELGIKGIREGDTLKRLASASEMMGDMTNLANKAWEENSALTKEAQTRYETMASKIQLAKNKITDVAITVGNALMPALDSMLDKMDEINWDKVGEKLSNKIQWVIEHFDQLKVALGILAGAFATFKVAEFINTLSGAAKEVKILMDVMGTSAKIAKFKGALSGMAGVLKSTSVAQWLLNTSLFGCPIIWIIGAVVALVGVFVLLWKKCDGFREFWTNLWGKVKSIASSVGEWLKTFFTVTIPAFFATLPEKISTFLTNAKAKVVEWGTNLWAKAKEIGSNFISGVVTFFQQLPYKIGYIIGFAIGKVILFGQKLWTFATTKIPQFITAVINWFKQLPGRIWTWLTSTIQKITAWGAEMLSIGKQKAIQFVQNVVSFVKTLPNKIWTWLVNAASKVVSWGAQLASKGKAAAIKLKDAVVNGVKSIPSKMLSIGKNIVKGMWNGIKNAKDWLIGKIKSFAKGITDGIAKALGINSPSIVMEKLFKWVPVGAGQGIIKNAKYAVNAVKNMGGKVATAASKISPTITTKATAIANKVKSYATGGTVTSPHFAVVGDANETIVPHGNNKRNRSLLKEAAIGVGGALGGNTYNITFAPVVNGGNAEANRKMLEEERMKFRDMIDEYFAEKARLAY